MTMGHYFILMFFLCFILDNFYWHICKFPDSLSIIRINLLKEFSMNDIMHFSHFYLSFFYGLNLCWNCLSWILFTFSIKSFNIWITLIPKSLTDSFTLWCHFNFWSGDYFFLLKNNVLLLTLLQISPISPHHPTKCSPPPSLLIFATLLLVSTCYAYMFFG